MGKDPAVLFYTGDFLTGTITMTDEQVGKYIRLLCVQHQKGHLSKKDMLNICKTYDEDVFSKFETDENGLFFNTRLDEEINKRRAYSESRRKNRMKKGKKDMSNISSTYDKHMENENENENRDINKDNSLEKSEKPFFKTWQDLAKYARKQYNLDFNKDKWKFEMPPCSSTTTADRREWHKKWKPIITELNNTLNDL